MSDADNLMPLELWIHTCRYYLSFFWVLRLMHASPYLFNALLYGRHGIRKHWYPNLHRRFIFMRHVTPVLGCRLAHWSMLNFIAFNVFASDYDRYCGDLVNLFSPVAPSKLYIRVYLDKTPASIVKAEAPLTEIRKEYSICDYTFVSRLTQIVATNSNLRVLILVGNCINKKMTCMLVKGLERNTSLVELNISSNEICDYGATSIFEALRHNIALEDVNVNYNNITDSGAVGIFSAVSHMRLKNLSIAGNKIHNEGMRALAEMLAHNITLINVDASWNSVEIKLFDDLGNALKTNTRLSRLNVSWCCSSLDDRPADVTSLCEALRVNKSLTELLSSGNYINGDSAQMLADALKVNTGINKLDLSDNFIRTPGSTALAAALKVNTALVELNLRDNYIGPTGSNALTTALKINTHLQLVDLRMCNLVPDIDEVVLDVHRANPRIDCLV